MGPQQRGRKGRESGYQVRALSLLKGSLPQCSSLEGPQVCGHYFHKVTTYLPCTVRLTHWWEESSCWPQRALMWFRKETRKAVPEKSFLIAPYWFWKQAMDYHVFQQLISNHTDFLSLPHFFISVTLGPQGRSLEASIEVAERQKETVMDLHMGECMHIIQWKFLLDKNILRVF